MRSSFITPCVLGILGAGLLVNCSAGGDFGSEDALGTEHQADKCDGESRANAPISNQSRALGNIDGCSGTVIGPNKVLTAAHCIGDRTPSTITFRPQYGLIWPGVEAVDRNGVKLRPSVTRIVQGRDANDTEMWADWAILTLNKNLSTELPAGTYVAAQRTPPSGTSNIDITHQGYPGNPDGGLPTWTFNPATEDCKINATDPTGFMLHGCDVWGGASGGPIWNRNTTQIIGVQSAHLVGDCVTGGNVAANGTWFASAPDNAAGIAVSTTSNGRVQVYASDEDWPLISTRWQKALGASASFPWSAVDSAFSGGRRMAAVNLQNNRQQILLLNSAGGLRTKWQSALDGAFSAGWTTMTTPVSFKDIAASGGSGLVTQLYGLGTDNKVYTSYKTGDATSTWSDWCSLGTVTGATSLAAVHFGSLRQVFVATSSGSQTAWSSGNACSTWNTFQSFGGAGFQAITAGLTAAGEVIVYASPNTTGEAPKRRVRAVDGSSWTPWGAHPWGNPINTTGFKELALGRKSDGNWQLFGIASNGEIYVTQESSVLIPRWTRFYK